MNTDAWSNEQIKKPEELVERAYEKGDQRLRQFAINKRGSTIIAISVGLN